MRLLLDTVTFLFAFETPERLSHAAHSALHNPANVRELSVVSLAEIALKNAIGKIGVGRTETLTAIEDLQLKIMPCTADHTFRLFGLPLHHRDPFDRQIIAQALSENLPVVTCDPQFRLYEGLTIIW